MKSGDVAGECLGDESDWVSHVDWLSVMKDKAVPGKMVAAKGELRADGMTDGEDRGAREIREEPRRGSSDRDTRSGVEWRVETTFCSDSILPSKNEDERAPNQKAAILCQEMVASLVSVVVVTRIRRC